MIRKSIRLARHFLQFSIVRFCLIGGLSFLLFVGFYAALSRWIWPTGNRTLESYLAVCLASVFNFLAHRSYTYQSTGGHANQIPRYLFVVVTATGLQTGLFWLGHEYLKFYDLAVIIVVSAVIPLYTYLMHRLFTFRGPSAPASAETPTSVV